MTSSPLWRRPTRERPWIPSLKEESLLLHFDEKTLYMYDGIPLASDGLYHYTLYRKEGYSVYLGKEELIKPILAIIGE